MFRVAVNYNLWIIKAIKRWTLFVHIEYLRLWYFTSLINLFFFCYILWAIFDQIAFGKKFIKFKDNMKEYICVCVWFLGAILCRGLFWSTKNVLVYWNANRIFNFLTISNLLPLSRCETIKLEWKYDAEI